MERNYRLFHVLPLARCLYECDGKIILSLRLVYQDNPIHSERRDEACVSGSDALSPVVPARLSARE